MSIPYGRQSVNDAEIDRFLGDHGVTWQTDTEIAGEHLVETAGRICYMSFAKPRPGGNQAYIGHILEVGHGSVLEHAVWNFLFTGVSRSLTHELIRHRAGFGYSQLSQRYVDESVAEYVEPDCIANDPELHQLWLDAVADSHKAYIQLTEKLMKVFENEPEKTLRRKLARQAARSVLPNATETKIFVTGFITNALLAALLAFIGDRLGIDLYLVALFAFGLRIFQNVAVIRRHFL